MTRIIHCADIHLDARMTANLSPEQARERRNELLRTFGRMVEFAKQKGVKAIIIAGDLYDKKSISSTAEKTVLSLIRNNPDIEFYYLRGNHDAVTLGKEASEGLSNLRLFPVGEWGAYPLGETGIVITGTELQEKDVRSKNVIKSEITNKITNKITFEIEDRSIFETLVLNRRAFNIVVLHGQLENCMADTASLKQKAAMIPVKALQNKGIDYLALGHIHSKMAGRVDARGIWCYPGCLEGRGFDECGEHGFLLLDIDGDRQECTVSFVPIAERSLHEVEVEISGCRSSQEIYDRIETRLSELKYPEKDLLKILLVGELEAESEINTGYLDKKLEAAYYSIQVRDHTTLRIDERDYLYDPSLKGEFVRRVKASDELNPSEKLKVIRNGLRLLMGEDIYED